LQNTEFATCRTVTGVPSALQDEGWENSVGGTPEGHTMYLVWAWITGSSPVEAISDGGRS
jgi:hypothetical protein